MISTIVSPLLAQPRGAPPTARALRAGESTAVGSSRIRILAPRYNVLRISTRCASPTERSATSLLRLDNEPGVAGELSHLVGGALVVERDASRRRLQPSTTFSATVSVGTSMKCWCTMPIAGGDRIVGGPPVTSRPFTSTRARVGLDQPAQHAHQRRFAGAVLADEGVDLAGHDLERRAAISAHGSPKVFSMPAMRIAGAGCLSGSCRASGRRAHRVLGTLMRPAMISCFSSSTRARTLSGMSARLRSS